MPSIPDVTSAITPYRIDVNQGNYVTQEMVAQLKPGLTREQVRFVLGTPLLTDIFHADRWDYVYRLQPGHGELQQRRFTVYFEDNKLTRVSGDVVSAGKSDAETGASPTSHNRVVEIAPEDREKKGEAAKKVDVAPAQDKK